VFDARRREGERRGGGYDDTVIRTTMITRLAEEEKERLDEVDRERER